MVAGLENRTTYLLQIRTVSGLGSSRATSVEARPATVPGTPTNLMAVGGTGRLSFSWNRPLDGGIVITEVWVELVVVDGDGWQSFVAGALTTTANTGVWRRVGSTGFETPTVTTSGPVGLPRNSGFWSDDLHA